VTLLNRMALVAEEGFESLLPAAELLGKYGRTAEAAVFFRRRIQAVPWDAVARVELARSLPMGSPERGPLIAFAVTDSLATYELRAQAARMAKPGPSPAAAGAELALLSSAHITPEAAAKPYQVEARIDAAGQSSDPEVQLRLWREALAIDPADPRVRLGALRASMALKRDSLSLALEKFRPSQRPSELSGDEQASIDESLAAAAERLDDLATAQNYLRQALVLRSGAQRQAVQQHIAALEAEQSRRSRNVARQPQVREQIEQGQIVAPRVAGSQP
jgi:hypothetical protein